jgi:hypothetical protein
MRTNKNTETQQQQYITVKRKTTRYNSVNIYMYLNACNAAKKKKCNICKSIVFQKKYLVVP